MATAIQSLETVAHRRPLIGMASHRMLATVTAWRVRPLDTKYPVVFEDRARA